MKKSKKTKEFVLDVTQEDYEKEIADGMPREYAMKPGKHVFRRGTFFERHGVTPEQMKSIVKDRRNTKLIITVRIDADIVDFFKTRAEKPGAPGYQTQMNDALRAFMEGAGQMPAGAEKLLENETFIEALAKKVRGKNKPKITA